MHQRRQQTITMHDPCGPLRGCLNYVDVYPGESSMIRRMTRLLLAMALAVATTVGFSSSPAMADDGDTMAWTYYDSVARGQAVWYSNGDSLKVCDMSADGRGIRGVVYAWVSSGSYWTSVLTVTDSNASDGCKTGSKNLAEGRKVQILVYQYWGDNTCCGAIADGNA
jgi:hypothetical protein